MDNGVEACMNVYLKDGKMLKFREVEFGVYMFCFKVVNKHNQAKVGGYSFLTLVSKNKSNFTRREVKMPDEARCLYR